MRKLILFLILLAPFSYSLFSQVTQLELDTFNRSIPTANFGGQTWRGPSWVDTVFNDSVATMHPDVLGYPPCADLWDWQNGWFYPQSVLDTCAADSIVLTWGQLNAHVISITPENFQNALNQISAEGLYCLNMISSSMNDQLANLKSAKANGVHFERIRLGDEMGKAGNELSISNFPTAADYASTCDIYIDSIRNILPNTKIAVSAGNFGGNSNPRSEFWNNELYNMTNKADAFRWSAFFYLKDADTIFTTKQLLAYAFDQIPTYEKARGFEDTISALQNYELWVGYGITDNTTEKRYLNRWSLVLMFSTSHHIFLNNKLVEDISMFNVAGIFPKWDALDTEDNFRKRATGVFATIWNKAKLYKNKATKIKTPISLIDTVTYYNNNNVTRDIGYPKLFGWRFENDSNYKASIVLTNISKDTLIISAENLLAGNVEWEKWHSDSLFDVIDSVNYINLVKDTGLTNIILMPYSLNIATGFMCNPSTYNSTVSICQGDSIIVGSSIYDTSGVYQDTLNTVHGCDSIISTTIIVEQNTFSYDTLSISGSMIWNGILLNVSGDYTVILTNSLGCDSIVNINLTITNNTGISNIKDSKKTLLKTTDILGRETKQEKQILFYIYENGTVEKRIVVE